MSNLSGRLFISVGLTGTGKTFTAKEVIKRAKMPVYAFDVNNEYTDLTCKRKLESNFTKFMEGVNLVTGWFVLIDEASIFFSQGTKDEMMRNLCGRKRHTKNAIYLNFLSFRQIPLELLDICDILIIKKTGNSNKYMRTRFKDDEDIYKAWVECMKSKDKYCTKILDLRSREIEFNDEEKSPN